MIKESEIMKYDSTAILSELRAILTFHLREDDSKWPEKNKDGRQELEIRLGNDHIFFEVC